jgi:hypothetical protein
MRVILIRASSRRRLPPIFPPIQLRVCARGGVRTHTPLREGGFKTGGERPVGVLQSVELPAIWAFRPSRPSSALQ